jgi:hydroxyacylglutathione hydrolase
MEIKTFTSGAFQVNSYLLVIEKEAIIIDPFESKEILKEIRDIKLKYILLTHGHIDHILAVNEIKEKTNAKIAIHKDDLNLLNNENENMSISFNVKLKKITPDIILEDNQILQIKNKELKIIHTPGHTQGSISILIDNNLFSGDTLFEDSIGRTDLPTGSLEQEINSIKTKLLTLPENTILYPGHGEKTTIKQEKENNPFLK